MPTRNITGRDDHQDGTNGDRLVDSKIVPWMTDQAAEKAAVSLYVHVRLERHEAPLSSAGPEDHAGLRLNTQSRQVHDADQQMHWNHKRPDRNSNSTIIVTLCYVVVEAVSSDGQLNPIPTWGTRPSVVMAGAPRIARLG